MPSQTRMDHRAELLAGMIRRRIRVLAVAMRPEGAPVPFTEQVTNEDALTFWRKHRYSPLGQRILAAWTPQQLMELDEWLGRNPDPALAGL